MKKFWLVLFLIVSAFCVGINLYAANEPEEHVTMIPRAANTYDAGSAERPFRALYFYDGIFSDDVTVADDLTVTGTVTATGGLAIGSETITAINKTLPLPIFSATLGSGAAVLSTTTTPGIEEDNELPSIVWADGETSFIQTTFAVPNDYVSGGRFKLLADESTSTTPHQIDFSVFVNSNGGTWDSSATDQTPVALDGTASTPCVVTLTPSTDFATLAAGQYVTVRFWRDDVSTGTGDLEIYNAYFDYD